ncbi:putative reverse transcriptase zinc-binding domain-containing protein [Helianthus annuus]|nr:putative reverse transcriptase zinc-binding domain-containing protein [Helianthus annuus]KAJ0934846.1 putative reverse transcriptase zinc-binding domain-containing protein [Helianthus annuus]
MVAWRAVKDSLPTRDALLKRNVPVESEFCCFCGEWRESSEHIFISCSLARYFWQIILQWCKFSHHFLFDLKDLLDLQQYMNGSKKRKKAFYAIILTGVWSLWRMRNEVIFNNKSVSLPKTVKETVNVLLVGKIPFEIDRYVHGGLEEVSYF